MIEKESLRLLLENSSADLPFSPESDGENGSRTVYLIVINLPPALNLGVRELIHLASIMDSTDSPRDSPIATWNTITTAVMVSALTSLFGCLRLS